MFDQEENHSPCPLRDFEGLIFARLMHWPLQNLGANKDDFHGASCQMPSSNSQTILSQIEQ